MDMNEIRRRSLARVVAEFETMTAAAEKAGVSLQHISQLSNGRVPFGEKTARKLELAFGLKPGALDRDLIGGSGDPTDDETIRLAKRFQALSARDRSAVSALIDRLLAA